MKYIKEFKGLDRLTCPNMKHCNNRSARYSEVVDEIIKALRTYAEDVHELIDAPQKNTEIQKTVTASLVKELNALETQQERLYEFLEKGIYTSEVFVKRDTALAKRRSELSEAIAEAQKHEIKDIDYKNRYVSLSEAIKALEDDSVSIADKNRLLRSVIKDITYHRESSTRGRWENVPFELDIEFL